MHSHADKIIELKSFYCSKCGTSLSDALFSLKCKRQVVEIPPIVPIYEAYRQYACACPTCQHEQIADFPVGVTAPIQYGSSVESLVGYLSVYQTIPFARLQNLFRDVFSLPFSQGTIDNILQRAAIRCQGVYQIIKTQIAQSTVVGSDETCAKVNGKKWWMWVWQNRLNTFIVPSDNRGYETIEHVWKNGLSNAILVADRWTAQLKSKTKGHLLCLAHLLRNIIYLENPKSILLQPNLKSSLQISLKLEKNVFKNKNLMKLVVQKLKYWKTGLMNYFSLR